MMSLKGKKSNVHEWVEHTLDECAGLIQSSNEGSNRFVFDGFAEYVSIRFTKYLPTYYLSCLQDLLKQDMTIVNLPEKFQWQAKQYQNPDQLTDELIQFQAGYPLSFVFWERISAEYGRDLPKRFLAHLRKKSRGDYKSCLLTLEYLTESNSFRSWLKAIDVAEAIQCIQNVSKSHMRNIKIEPASAADG